MDRKGLIKDLCTYYWKEITLLLISILYLIFLHKFNKELLMVFSQDDYVGIVKYQNFKALLYFAIALSLSIFAVAIAVYRVNQIRCYEHEVIEIIWNLLSICGMIILIITIICFINNPIFKAIVVVFVSAVAYVKFLAQ